MPIPPKFASIIFIVSLLTSQVNAKILDGLSLSYYPGVCRLTSQTNSGSGLHGLGIGVQHRLAFRLNLHSTAVFWYTGAQYIAESIGGRISLYDDPKYGTRSATGYSNNCFGFPLGAKIKLNNKEKKLTFLTIELLFGIYARESYTYKTSLHTYITATNTTTYENTTLPVKEEFSGLVRYLLSFGIERETPVGDRLTLIRGFTFSPGIKTINRNTATNFKSASLNAFLGLCFR